MATVEENYLIWNSVYDWKDKGDEWSETWGGVDMQWFGEFYLESIFPCQPNRCWKLHRVTADGPNI